MTAKPKLSEEKKKIKPNQNLVNMQFSPLAPTPTLLHAPQERTWGKFFPVLILERFKISYLQR